MRIEHSVGIASGTGSGRINNSQGLARGTGTAGSSAGLEGEARRTVVGGRVGYQGDFMRTILIDKSFGPFLWVALHVLASVQDLLSDDIMYICFMLVLL